MSGLLITSTTSQSSLGPFSNSWVGSIGAGIQDGLTYSCAVDLYVLWKNLLACSSEKVGLIPLLVLSSKSLLVNFQNSLKHFCLARLAFSWNSFLADCLFSELCDLTRLKK